MTIIEIIALAARKAAEGKGDQVAAVFATLNAFEDLLVDVGTEYHGLWNSHIFAADANGLWVRGDEECCGGETHEVLVGLNGRVVAGPFTDGALSLNWNRAGSVEWLTECLMRTLNAL